MRRLKKIILVSVFVVFLLLIINSFVFAQRPLEVDYPTIEGARPQDTSFTLPEYVKYIFNFSLAIAGLIAFAVLVYGGFGYLTSVGSPVKQKDARDRIFAAILGLIVLFCSYLILTTINPQLIFLSIPERAVFTPESITGYETEVRSLAYTEIPLGGLIGELFSNTRLTNIKNIAKETKEIAEEVKKLSAELSSLAAQCACSLTISQCPGKPCGIGYCQGDPCSVREEINQKREEIQKYISDQEFEVGIEEFGELKKVKLKGLKYWQEKLYVEINGFSEGEERIIGFREVYEDLKAAENMIKKCPFSASKNGKSQILLGYSGFLEYQNYLKGIQKVEKFEATYPFDHITSDQSYYLANFYCAEVFYQISPISISEENLSQAGGEVMSAIEPGETFCGSEIAIGETTDNTEELARRILVELDNINSNALEETEAAQNLINLANPENCVVSNCYNECIWIEQICCVPCEEENGEDGGEDGEGDGGGENGGWDSFFWW